LRTTDLLSVLVVAPVLVPAVVDVVLEAGGDIVDVGRRFVLEVVDVVDPAAGALLDRTTRAVFLLRALLAAQTTRRGRRAEIRTAVAAWAS